MNVTIPNVVINVNFMNAIAVKNIFVQCVWIVRKVTEYVSFATIRNLIMEDLEFHNSVKVKTLKPRLPEKWVV